jgi:hypothetical protein
MKRRDLSNSAKPFRRLLILARARQLPVPHL